MDEQIFFTEYYSYERVITSVGLSVDDKILLRDFTNRKKCLPSFSDGVERTRIPGKSNSTKK